MEDLRELIEIFTKVDTNEEMQKLFEELFTQREIYDCALRWRLLKELYEGTPQREIASQLGISLCKITRGSRILKDPNSQLKKLLQEHNNGKINK